MNQTFKNTHHLTVFGASRGVGRAVVEQALALGHSVTAVARNAAQLQKDYPEARIVEGDVTDPETVQEALVGADAVVCALGAKALSNSRVRSEGTRVIANEMRRAGLSRIFAISLMGARESKEHLPFLFRYVIFPFYLRKAVADHERQEDLLEKSNLDFTIVRPPNLDDGPVSESYAHGTNGDWNGLSLVVSRSEVAHFILQQLGAAQYSRQAVWVSRTKAA